MIGPTGVGKTEVARRMAKLVGAPLLRLKLRNTEVGYVGRDVESMVRDLVETSVRIERRNGSKSTRQSRRTSEPTSC